MPDKFLVPRRAVRKKLGGGVHAPDFWKHLRVHVLLASVVRVVLEVQATHGDIAKGKSPLTRNAAVRSKLSHVVHLPAEA